MCTKSVVLLQVIFMSCYVRKLSHGLHLQDPNSFICLQKQLPWARCSACFAVGMVIAFALVNFGNTSENISVFARRAKCVDKSPAWNIKSKPPCSCARQQSSTNLQLMLQPKGFYVVWPSCLLSCLHLVQDHSSAA